MDIRPIKTYLLAALSGPVSADVPSYRRHEVTPQYLTYVGEAFDRLQKGLDEQSIENARLKEVLETINRALDRFWERIPRPELNRSDDRRSVPQAVDDKCSGYPGISMATLAGRIKAITKVEDHPVRNRVLEAITPLAPLAEAYTQIRPLAKKRVLKTAEERAAEQFAVPQSSSKAVAEVTRLLEEVMAEHYAELVQQFQQRNRLTLRHYVEAAKAAEADPTLRQPSRYHKDGYEKRYEPRWHLSVKSGPYKGTVMDGEALSLLQEVLEPHYPKGQADWVYAPRADAKALCDKKGEERADYLRKMFIAKNLRKIAAILEGKGDDQFLEAKVLNNSLSIDTLQGQLGFRFKDGSSFSVSNAVVFVVNQFHTQFYRFPLTFHDVKMADGQAMPRPSEQRMHEVFLGQPVEPEAQPQAAPKPARRGIRYS
jgi:hypothetical protein